MQPRHIPGIRTALLCLVALASLCSAQNEPVFRSGTRLVQVNVVVRGKSGPATGLTKDDFTLLEDGKHRTISVFSVVEAHTNGSSSHPSTPQPLDPGMVSNRSDARGETPTTATVLLIDRLNTPVANQPFTNAKIIEFLQKHGSGQRLGIYTLGSNVQVIQELTSDPERLLRAAARIRPQDVKRMAADITMDATGVPLIDMMAAHALTDLQDFATADRVEVTRSALEAIARHLAKVPGRKNLIWISASFPIIVIRPHEVLDYSRDVDRAALLLNDADIAVYPVDPRGISATVGGIGDAEEGPGSKCGRGPCRIIAPPDPAKAPDSGLDTMNTLAALTGGRAFYHDNGIDESIRKAIEDAEVTYTLGFYPPDDAFDDHFHKLTVKVDRRGLEIRSRAGYFASKAGPDAAASHPTLNQLLDDSLDATEIGVRAGAVPDISQTSSWVVRAIIDLHDLELSHQNGRATGDVDVSFFVDDARSVRTVTHKIDLSEAQLAAALDAGLTLDNSIPADAKAREIRIVVQDHATGAAGSVRVPIRK